MYFVCSKVRIFEELPLKLGKVSFLIKYKCIIILELEMYSTIIFKPQDVSFLDQSSTIHQLEEDSQQRNDQNEMTRVVIPKHDGFVSGKVHVGWQFNNRHRLRVKLGASAIVKATIFSKDDGARGFANNGEQRAILTAKGLRSLDKQLLGRLAT